MTPSGMEPATFRLVAQCLNELRHRVPFLYVGHRLIPGGKAARAWRYPRTHYSAEVYLYLHSAFMAYYKANFSSITIYH
jgi:hypothetical protein